MNYTLDIIAQDDSPITVNLYLDVNGDSLYKDKELVKTVNLTPVNRKIENANSYTLPNDFVGQLEWKLEAEINKSVTGENVGATKLVVLSIQLLMKGKKDKSITSLPDKRNILDLKEDRTIKSLISGLEIMK